MDEVKVEGFLVTGPPSFGIYHKDGDDETPSIFNDEDLCELLSKYDNEWIRFELKIEKTP